MSGLPRLPLHTHSKGEEGAGGTARNRVRETEFQPHCCPNHIELHEVHLSSLALVVHLSSEQTGPVARSEPQGVSKSKQEETRS